MRSAVIYYSFSGNTHRVAQVLTDILKEKGDEVIPVRIRPLKEEKNFLLQCKGAFFGNKPELYRTLLDMKGFDRILIGSPVWAFKPAPAINTYLDKCSSLEAKTAVCFVTYASGAGKDKALDIMKKALEQKGVQSVKTISFQQDEAVEACKASILKIL